MQIDAHHHLWTYNEEEFPWITESLGVIKHDFHGGDLKPLVQAEGVSGTVAVQARPTEDENRFLLHEAELHPDVIKAVVGWVDLTKPTARAGLAKWSQHPKFVGVRHIDEPDDNFLLRPDFLAGVALLKEFHLTYDILVFNRHLKTAAEFVKRFPDQPFVLDHIAKPDIKNHVLEPWASDIKALAALPNVLCKVSGMVTEASANAPYEDFVPYLDVIFEAFGPSRVMIGSDWPVSLLSRDYHATYSIVKKYIAKYSEEEQKAVLGGNAAQFYGIRE